MNENDVIKAIECCIQEDANICDVCPFYDKEKGCKDTGFDMLAYALEIIKNKDIELQAMRNAANSYKAEAEKLAKENEQFACIGLMYSEVRSDVIKAFAKKLKNKMFSEDFLLCEPSEMADLIDDTVDEMTEGGNGK